MLRPSKVPLIDETDPLYPLLRDIMHPGVATSPSLVQLRKLSTSGDVIILNRLRALGLVDLLLRMSATENEEIADLSSQVISNLCGSATRGEVWRQVSVGDQFLIEIREPPYLTAGLGYKIWPSALLLNRLLCDRTIRLDDVDSVLELGSGTGVTGIVCNKLGVARVVMSDFSVPVLENIRVNVSKNVSDSRKIEVVHLDWADIASGAAKAKERFRVILGADLIYDSNGPAQQVLAVWHEALEISPDARAELVLPSSQIRHGVSEFETQIADASCPFLCTSRKEYAYETDCPQDDHSQRLTHYTLRWRKFCS